MATGTNTFGQVVDIVTKLGVIAGSIFAAWQYWEAKELRRIERTTHYLERYESGRIAEARERIEGGLRPHLGSFEEVSAGGLSPQARESVVLAVLEETPAIPAAIDNVADYFNGLETCVRAKLCDRATAERYFRETDIGIWQNFDPYIAQRRRNNPDYGGALEHYSLLRQPSAS